MSIERVAGSMDDVRTRCRIKTLEKPDFQRWDDYIFRNAGSTFFHRAGWKTVLEKAFGHKTYYLYAERDGRIAGVLPLAQVKSLLFGNMLVSTPFCVYGGVVADDREAEEGLISEACRLAEDLKVDALEMRDIEQPHREWPINHLYATFRKGIDPDEKVNFNGIPPKQRTMIRKAGRQGLSSEPDAGIEGLYRVYAESVRNLGTPVFGKKYLKILWDVFADDSEVLMIRQKGRDVAGVLSFYFRDEVLPYYGGSNSLGRVFKGANHFMYWELLKRSGEQGLKVFDFGRSKLGTGAYDFKRHFGFEPTPLHYNYHLVRRNAIPEKNPTNPKYQYFIKAWKKLPLAVANRLGPPLAKSLG